MSSGTKSHTASRLPTPTSARTADPTTRAAPVASRLPVPQSRSPKSSSVNTKPYRPYRPACSPAAVRPQTPGPQKVQSPTPAKVGTRFSLAASKPIVVRQQWPVTLVAKHSDNAPRGCPECRHALLLPPSIKALRRVYPQLVVNESIDRSIQTCRHCAYQAATRRAMQSQFMWPSSANYLLKLDGEQKATLKRLEAVQGEVDASIEAGTRDPDALAKKLQDAHDAAAKVQYIKEMAASQIRAGKRLAWVPFWAVWGKMEGQEGYVREVPPAKE